MAELCAVVGVGQIRSRAKHADKSIAGMVRVAAERDLIERAIARWPGLPNREIAERLGTNRRVLELRMKEYGISKQRHR